MYTAMLKVWKINLKTISGVKAVANNKGGTVKDDCYRGRRRFNKVRLEFIIGFWPFY